MAAVEILGKQVTFEVATAVAPGDRLAVTVDQNQSMEISVECCRDLGNGNYLVVGQSPDAMLTSSSNGGVLGQRRHPRAKQRLRVMSVDLPEYQALTIDCSATGLQMETLEPIAVGEFLRLQLGVPNLGEDVEADVEVVWCQPWDGNFRVGCRFTQTPARLVEALDMLLQIGHAPTPKRPSRPRRQLSGLPLRPPPVDTDEEQAPLLAQLNGYAMDGDHATLKLDLESGETREISFDGVKSLRDLRGLRGKRIGFLSCQQLPSGARRIRFLTPAREKVLEIVIR